MDIIAIIPARSGSKRLPNKNIKLFAGKPLLFHSIDHALELKVSEIIVSSDSKQYLDMVDQEYGNKVRCIKRSKELSKDLTPDLPVFQSIIEPTQKRDHPPELVIHLRPTSPIRNIKDTRKMLKIMVKNFNKLDSCRSISKSPHNPYKMYFKNEKNLLDGFRGEEPVYYPSFDHDMFYRDLPDQMCPEVYIHNGNVDVIRCDVICPPKVRGKYIHVPSMSGVNIYGYEINPMPPDINTEEDWLKAEKYAHL